MSVCKQVRGRKQLKLLNTNCTAVYMLGKLQQQPPPAVGQSMMGGLRLTETPTSGLLFLSAICHISKGSEAVSGRRRKSRMMVYDGGRPSGWISLLVLKTYTHES